MFGCLSKLSPTLEGCVYSLLANQRTTVICKHSAMCIEKGTVEKNLNIYRAERDVSNVLIKCRDSKNVFVTKFFFFVIKIELFCECETEFGNHIESCM